MTTLPQTTNPGLRVPRSGGSSHLGPMVGGVPAFGPVAGQQAAPGLQMNAADVWRVLRANLWLILLLVVGSGVAGYYWFQHELKYNAAYTATGMMQILPPQSGNSAAATPIYESSQFLMVELNTEVQRFKSSSLISELLKDPESGIRNTNWYTKTCGGDRERAEQAIREGFAAEPQGDSQLIKVSMTASDPGDASLIVHDVGERAIADQRRFVASKYAVDEARISQVKLSADSALSEAQDTLDRATKEVIRLGGVLTGGVSPNQMLLARAVDRQTLAETASYAADYAYNEARRSHDAGETPSAIRQLVDHDEEVTKYRRMIEEIDSRISSSGDSEGSPYVKQLKEQRAAFERQLRNVTAEKTDLYTDSYMSQSKTAMDNTGAEKKRASEDVAKWMATNIQIQEATEKRQSDYYKVQKLETEVSGYRAALQNVQQMMRQSELGLMNWFSLPEPPSAPSSPRLATDLTTAIVVGLALGLGIAFLRELTDTSVRSPRDIVRIGQMSLLGMIPHENDDPQLSGARLPLVIYEAPTSIMAERLRDVRTRLQHTASLDTTRSILVTSPGPGDGKTMVATNLAAGLALNGRRILLVDANFRRPELHKIFGFENTAGFGDALSDVSMFPAAVRESSVPNLSVMTSGSKPGNATELLESQLLVDFTERALEEFDHVIFDSGPMLLVSESGALAPRVDGVITVVKARASSRGVLQRMRDSLRSLKAEHLGVVLNGVRTQAGGYYAGAIKTYYKYQNAN